MLVIGMESALVESDNGVPYPKQFFYSFLAACVLTTVICGFVWFLFPIAFSLKRATPRDISNKFGEQRTEEDFRRISNSNNEYSSSAANDSSIDLSVIITVLNEEARISIILDEVIGFLSQRARSRFNSTKDMSYGTSKPYNFEIIVLDAGSTDSTREAVQRFSRKHSIDKVKLVESRFFQHMENYLKCLISARGENILTMDANRPVPIEDLARLESDMAHMLHRSGQGIVIGSHAHFLIEGISSHGPLHAFGSDSLFTVRVVLLSLFRVLFQTMCLPDLYDTQCPYKLFTRNAARQIFPKVRLRSIGLDSEVLFIANEMKIPIKERAVGVSSKIFTNIPSFENCLNLLRDLIVMRTAYALGFWSIN